VHKQLLNEIEIKFELEPYGPILIKASDNNDPTKPDMEFVRTKTKFGSTPSIYLPGSSLKGAFRAHCEKLARTVQTVDEPGKPTHLACNPLDDQNSCGDRFNRLRRKPEKDANGKDKELLSTQIYKESCFICRLFGNTNLGAHLRIADAMPVSYASEDKETNPNSNTETRNGVAIDRLFGSVAVGPFQFEVSTAGRFTSSISIRNFTIAQLGLLGLMLRDLENQRLLIGFAKSRGLGRVYLHYTGIEVRYPMATQEGEKLKLASVHGDIHHVYGMGALVNESLQRDYALPKEDKMTTYDLGSGQSTLQIGTVTGDALDGVTLTIAEADQIKAFWRTAAKFWKDYVPKEKGRVA
jgi:CRISPR-associated RAMP protein (TIGR02581 family)